MFTSPRYMVKRIMTEYDHVVVGAGIVGSWTALHLNNLGKNVLLLEQFGEPHTRGSSQGQTRIIRTCYSDKFFANMMPHAIKMWKELEKDTEKRLIINVGSLFVASSPHTEEYKNCVSNMKSISPGDLEELSYDDVQKKLSKTVHFNESNGFLFDKTGGILLAHKAVMAVQALFRKRGGHLWDCCQVSKVESDGDKVTLVTAKGNVTAKSAVVCAGPWTQKLLTPHLVPSLPLQPQVVKACYWKIKEKDAYRASNGFPNLQRLGEPHIYALPSYEYPGFMKVSYHGGVPCDPDFRDKAPSDPKIEAALKAYVKEHLPLLETEPAIVEKCMYTVTPDERFIVDSLPNHKNIFLGAGFSGTGFKTSPVVGRILSELATGARPFLDIPEFRLSRFSKT